MTTRLTIPLSLPVLLTLILLPLLILLTLACPASAAPIPFEDNLLGNWQADYLTDYTVDNSSQFLAGTYGTTMSHPLWQDSDNPDPAFYVNGRTDKPSTVWQKSFFAPAGAITISAELTNLCCKETAHLVYPGPDLLFALNGSPLGTAMTDGAGNPDTFSFSFWNAVEGWLSLALLNKSTVYDGNDFKLSDLVATVSDKPVPEPASLLLLGTGLGWVGRRMMKRRRLACTRC